VNPAIQAKLLVYKAYKIGRESVSQCSGENDTRAVSAWLKILEARPPTEDNLRRRLFYTLILAEIHRLSDPVPFRETALELGEKLEAIGAVSPFPLYMRIIGATTNSPSAGNFGDIATPAVIRIQDSWSDIDQFGNIITVDLAQSALEMSNHDLDKFYRFLRKPLLDIARGHDLVE
jgi:hypothetical protein